jgi:hypothetical protein
MNQGDKHAQTGKIKEGQFTGASQHAIGDRHSSRRRVILQHHNGLRVKHDQQFQHSNESFAARRKQDKRNVHNGFPSQHWTV